MLFQAIKKTEFLAKTPKIWNSQKGPERNKVKSFGDPSIAHGEMADWFLIVGAFNAPLVTNRVIIVSIFYRNVVGTPVYGFENGIF